MIEGLEEHLELFKEQWESAKEISPNLKWAIFPVGSKEIEFQAAKHLMSLFENVEGFVFFKENQDPEEVVRVLEEVLQKYKQKNKERLALAAEQNDYQLHVGS